jgi:hypothetical protein
VAFALAVLGQPASALTVDVELVLAIDVSRSVDDEEAALQRQGYIQALTNDRVIRAIQSGAHGGIAVTYVEWAGAAYQQQVIPWTLIRDAAAARAFVAQIAAAPRVSMSRTSISGAIDFSVPLFDDNGFEGARRVIDVSGDGQTNQGRPSWAARDDAVAKGVIINGLPILNDRSGWGPYAQGDLGAYYETNVIGGEGAFMMAAEDFHSFGDAILAKLIKEIADDRSAAPRRFARAAP